MNYKPVIIFGSSRNDGNTRKMANAVREALDIPLVDLAEKDIAPYDYEYNNKDDDFLPTIEEVIENFDTIIFATPVYWYSMSAQLKTFIDRFSDLVRIHKDTGRKLRGKNMALISCASDEELYPEFPMPFIRSANYLGMNYLGNVHGYVNPEGELPKGVKENILKFVHIFKN